MGVRDPDLWTCPRCGARFVTRNMWHGCGDYTVDGFFEGKAAKLRELYEAWVALVGEFGPFEQVPDEDHASRSLSRCGFAGVARAWKDGLSAGSG